MIALPLPALLLPGLLAPPALAAEPSTFDAHGFVLAPQERDPLGTLVLTRPGRFEAGALSLAAVFEYAHAPLVARQFSGDAVVYEQALLSDLFVMNTRAGFAPASWLRLGAAVPVVFAAQLPSGDPSAGELGDVRVDATVVLARRDEGGFGQVGVAVTPFLDLPTGPTEALLGNAGVAGGGTASATWELGGVALGGELGVSFAPTIAYENLTGGDRFLLAGSVGVQATDDLGVTLEAVARPKMRAGSGGDSPAEVLLSVRSAREDGGFYTAGVATAASGGAGASDVRLFLGGGWGTPGARGPVDTDGDGIFDPDDTCPEEPETQNGRDDTDGCPDVLEPARMTLRVLSDGTQVSGAVVELSDGATTTRMSTGPDAWVGMSAAGAAWSARATKGACLSGAADGTLVAGDNALVVALSAQRSASIVVEAKDPTGHRVTGASVTWTSGDPGCVPSGAGATDTRVGIGPGVHTARVTAEGYRDATVEVTLAAGDDRAVEVTLVPTRIKVEAARIRILESVFFDERKATLQAVSYPLLDEIAALLVETPAIARVEIRGHTDADGSEASNLDLSQRRAESVRAYLVSKGVAAERLVAKGFGESQPIDTNQTAAGRAKNRRVEFAIVERR